MDPNSLIDSRIADFPHKQYFPPSLAMKNLMFVGVGGGKVFTCFTAFRLAPTCLTGGVSLDKGFGVVHYKQNRNSRPPPDLLPDPQSQT